MSSTMLAIGWEPELRGILTVLIGTVVWMGSIYLILGTNVGARLGFMVSFAGLAGWMALMGSVWWIYGIGLQGDLPSWQAVPGSTVIQEVDLLYQAGVLEEPIPFTSGDDPAEAAAAVAAQLTRQGWSIVDSSAPEFGQAEAAATVFLDEEGAFAPGEFQVTNVFEVNSPAESAWPKFGPNGEFDQLAFFKKPYYTLVEVAPLVELREEPGRAPIPPVIDEQRQRQYVYMIRDLGSLRQPAALITIGSTIIFLAMCWLLHRRDHIVAENRAKRVVAA